MGKNKANNNKPNKSNRIVERFASISLAPSVAKRVVKKSPPSKSVLSLPKCTLKYALALSDPFSPSARGACIPIGGSPSQKIHSFIRFDVVIGTTGTAIVYVMPSLANDMPSIIYTTSTYGGTLPIYTTSGTIGASGVNSALNTGLTYGFHNGPYTANQTIGETASGLGTTNGRIVSVGLRAQYTGTTLNESGLYYCYHDPGHSSLAGISYFQIGAFGDANVEGISRKPCMLTVHGVNDSELNFSSQASPEAAIANTIGATQAQTLYPYSNGDYIFANSYTGAPVNVGAYVPVSLGTVGAPVGVPIAVIGITGVAGQSVHLEYIQHMEFQGLAAASALTSTESDPPGAAMVRTAALALPASKLAQPDKSSWDLMYAGLGALWNAAKPYVVPAIEAGVIALLG